MHRGRSAAQFRSAARLSGDNQTGALHGEGSTVHLTSNSCGDAARRRISATRPAERTCHQERRKQCPVCPLENTSGPDCTSPQEEKLKHRLPAGRQREAFLKYVPAADERSAEMADQGAPEERDET